MDIEKQKKKFIAEADIKFKDACEQINNAFENSKASYIKNKGGLYDLLVNQKLRSEFITEYSLHYLSIKNELGDTIGIDLEASKYTHDLYYKLIMLPRELVNSQN